MYYEDDGPLTTMADAAREYHNQGLTCPFDCWRCQPEVHDPVGQWLLTFADGCLDTEDRYEEQEVPTGGYCTHGWQPVTKAVEFLGLPYVRVPDPAPVDPWSDDSPF